jgi:transcriptional regulator with XRE-family HTH domain
MTGSQLRHQRTSLGYTQLELAVLIGTSRAAVNRWENGDKPVKFLVVSFMAGLPPKVQL